jgi:hypothetical protein
VVQPEMWDEPHFYYCLTHGTVEPVDGCRNDNRLGPFATENEAAAALALARARTEEWDAEDRRWRGDDSATDAG